MDRNTVIGFVLLGLLLFVYLFVSTKNSHELELKRKIAEDSIANVQRMKEAALAQDSARKAATAVTGTTAVSDSGFNLAFSGTEQLLTVENNVLRIVFSNKGGQPVEIVLKNFKSYDSSVVKIADSSTDSRFSYTINTAPNQSPHIADLYFRPGQVQKNTDGSQTVTFSLPAPNGESIVHQYTIRPDDYMLDWNVLITGEDKLFTQNNFNLAWHAGLKRTQQNANYEKTRYTNICFHDNDGFDFISRNLEKQFDKPVQWLSLSQQFFNSTLIAKNGFSSGNVHWARSASDSGAVIATADAAMQAKIPAAASTSLSFQLYYGPSDYNILKKQAPDMDKIVDLGRGMYAFVRPLNVFVIMPVFNFFMQNIKNYGIAILLLTLFIRLLTSPLVYSSYLSGAKMKALRPEIEAMKKRVGDDQQQQGMEQMKLFREAGVNPLGGCIPALLQIPIFFALFSFFSSNIALRGEHFLWSKDLSAYDSVVNFGFSIPGYGDHISLFALLAVITSFLISLYGMSMTPDQSNPAMKYMPYIMPVMLLLFFNNLASALTWYYTVSNVITLLLQFVIQNYIIDHEKILVKLQENRTKPKTKSKWQERMEQMQEQQKQIQAQQKKK